MALFNLLTLRNILNGRNNLGTTELRAAVAVMSDEQRDNTLVFLECNTEELVGLPDGRGTQIVTNVRTLLDYLPTFEPNVGVYPVRVISKSADKVVSNLFIKFENFLVKSKMASNYWGKKMKSVGMTETKQMATLLHLVVLPQPCGLREKVFTCGQNWRRLQKNLMNKVKSLWRHC